MARRLYRSYGRLSTIRCHVLEDYQVVYSKADMVYHQVYIQTIQMDRKTTGHSSKKRVKTI